jgi:GMP synthase-like glutamine amidotransferase
MLGKNVKKNRRKPVLIVQHAPHEHPAAVRRALESQGIQTLWIHPYRGEPYPDPSEIRGMISLGGPMGANDSDLYPWIRTECELMRQCVAARKPIVGICLGGQMLARAMGAKVEKNRKSEIGWFKIQVNSAGLRDPILGSAGASPTVYHWHNDTFHLPKGAELLASSEITDRQAFRIEEFAYGFQFHPEADHQLVHEWLAIEGVEGEVEHALDLHGNETVQDARTQRLQAAEGERASIKITAAIGQLFSDLPYEPVDAQMLEQLQEKMKLRTQLLIEFEGPDRRPVRLKGHISNLLGIPHGDFVIFRENSTLLWPIRADHLLGFRAQPERKAKTLKKAPKSQSRLQRKHLTR